MHPNWRADKALDFAPLKIDRQRGGNFDALERNAGVTTRLDLTAAAGERRRTGCVGEHVAVALRRAAGLLRRDSICRCIRGGQAGAALSDTPPRRSAGRSRAGGARDWRREGGVAEVSSSGRRACAVAAYG